MNIGKGTTGSVELRGKHAVKRYFKEPYESFSEFNLRCAYEYNQLKRLHHRNIVTAYDYSSLWWRTQCTMTLEFVPYTLKAYLKREVDIGEIIKQIYEAVSYLHSQKVCHRDLKLDNILVTSDGTIKIIDFMDSRNEAKCIGLVGTNAFVAPEVFTQFEYDGYKADIWSMGIVFYWILHRKFPWKAARVDDEGYMRGEVPFGFLERDPGRRLVALREGLAKTRPRSQSPDPRAQSPEPTEGGPRALESHKESIGTQNL